MIQIGRLNQLKIIKDVDFGVYLDGGEDGEILLPLRDLPDDYEIGDEVEVFIYFDSEDRLIATTQKPRAMVGEFALLKVAAVERIGAFLDWGLPKDLLLPFAEQSKPVRVGQEVLVYIYLDSSDRIAASMRLGKNLAKTPGQYEEGQSVNLIIAGETELGFKAIINESHLGMIYANEIFQPLKYGQRLQGFVKKIRDDGKIDLSLQDPKKIGHRAAADEVGPRILKLLSENHGFLAINDKTSAETIHELFGVSKKKYKIALGGLYKQRLIRVDDNGIFLVKKP